MYKFSYEENVDRNGLDVKLPLPLGKLCWFIHPYELDLKDSLIKGYDSWCGHYAGMVVADFESMEIKHCIITSDDEVHNTDLIFVTKDETNDYIKNNLRTITYKKVVQLVEVEENDGDSCNDEF